MRSLSHPISHFVPPAARPAARCARKTENRGFTLVEVMMSCLIFAMVILGVYMMLIRSYQLAALSRCRDEARAVTRTYADQFERLQTTAIASNGGSYTRWLFYPEGGGSGRGLIWGGLSDSNVFDTPLTAVSNLAISLGESTHPVSATVTRNVSYVNAATGADASVQTIQAAGYMMRGTFTVSFTINKKNYAESLTVLRAVP
jgi:type II secretory pathway pseudopilin PulG